jgi:glutamate carboxypeptidase
MPAHPQILSWIDSQQERMLDLVVNWSGINSGTHHLDGVERFSAVVEKEFADLGAHFQRHPLLPHETVDAAGKIVQHPLADAISFTKRQHAQRKILLNIHLDTVYGAQHPFQRVTLMDSRTLRGPGVVDAKGGLVVLLTALRALERSDVAQNIGWEVLLNTDEEIGSVGSAPLLHEAAKRNHVGLIFEPALPDGSLVGARKGSGNFTVVFRGRAAHAGRDFHLGRSAILAAAQFISRLDAAQDALPGVTINCGHIEGGGAVNVVADLAIARFNIRVTHPRDQQAVERSIAEVAQLIGGKEGIQVQTHGGFTSPPKPIDARSARLFEAVQECGKLLGMNLEIHSSGGTCDGNRLAAAGLPVIDSMGPCGGHLHSEQEYLLIESLPQRAKLAAMLLLRIAGAEIEF